METGVDAHRLPDTIAQVEPPQQRLCRQGTHAIALDADRGQRRVHLGGAGEIAEAQYRQVLGQAPSWSPWAR